MRILKSSIYRSGEFGVSEIAKIANVSKGLVSGYFDYLAKEGVFRRKKNKFMVRDNIQTKAVKIFLNLNTFDTGLFRKYRFIKSVGVYGSLAKGTNTGESDIDLLIFIEPVREEMLAKLTAELKKTFGDVRPLYVTKEKLEFLKKNDVVFYYSLMFGSVTIYGEKLETI